MTKPFTEIILTEQVLSTDRIMVAVSQPECGAISLFVGTTRNHHGGKHVLELEYECYKMMAEKEIRKLCDEVRLELPAIRNIAVHHRLGIVPVQEASIIIAVSSPHRADAMEASKCIINSLKARVPIWKKEIYVDGSNEWQENKECVWGRNSPGTT